MTTPTEQVPELVVSVHDLARQPGSQRLQSITFQAPANCGDEQVIAIDPQAPVALDLLLESVLEGILVSGSLTAEAKGQCGRCLGGIQQGVQVTFQELFSYPERALAAVEAGAEDEQTFTVVDQTIDLNGPVRDALVLALPFQPLCQSECVGLCSQCGQALAGEPDHSHEQVDPRWSALEELLVTPEEES
ncbi:MAG: YceD family protein [Micrococcales bacterium]|nr:YceD family protein [Micrococcales bacterium]